MKPICQHPGVFAPHFCAINFSDKEQAFQISDMINGEFSLYMGENIVVKRNETVHLKPWSYAIETCMN
jgi:hypothetical protein